MATDKSRKAFWCQVLPDLENPLGKFGVRVGFGFLEKHRFSLVGGDGSDVRGGEVTVNSLCGFKAEEEKWPFRSSQWLSVPRATPSIQTTGSPGLAAEICFENVFVLTLTFQGFFSIMHYELG